MSRQQGSLRRAAPRSTSRGKKCDDVQIINELVPNLTVSDVELAALELLVGWDWLSQLLCGGNEPDV
jgi:hypothetical protein